MTPAELEKTLYNEFQAVYLCSDSRIDGRLVRLHVRKLAKKAYDLGLQEAKGSS